MYHFFINTMNHKTEKVLLLIPQLPNTYSEGGVTLIIGIG